MKPKLKKSRHIPNMEIPDKHNRIVMHNIKVKGSHNIIGLGGPLVS